MHRNLTLRRVGLQQPSFVRSDVEEQPGLAFPDHVFALQPDSLPGAHTRQQADHQQPVEHRVLAPQQPPYLVVRRDLVGVGPNLPLEPDGLEGVVFEVPVVNRVVQPVLDLRPDTTLGPGGDP